MIAETPAKTSNVDPSALANRGFPVYTGKHGPYSATTNVGGYGGISEMWRDNPEAAPKIGLGYRREEHHLLDGARPLRLAMLAVDEGAGGLTTLEKLRLTDLPKTVAIAHEDRRFLLFVLPEDVRLKARKLGPGVTLAAEGYGVTVPDESNGRIWLQSPDNVPVAAIPETLLNAEPVPEDEDEFSRGPLRRVALTPKPDAVPEPLFDDLLLRTGVHVFTGEPGVGKTNAAQAICVHLTKKGYRVVYFDADGNGSRIEGRLSSMGATPEDLTRFYYYKADGLTADGLAYLLDHVQPSLVVFDNLTNLLSRAGINDNDNVAVARWFNTYPAKVRDAEKAALILDHPAKAGSGRYAKGASSKLAEEDVAWRLTQTVPFDREKVGTVRFRLEKSNEGVRPKADPIYRVGGTPFVFAPTKAARLTDNQRKILGCLVDGASSADWLNAAKVDAGVQHNNTFYRAVDALLANGIVEADDAGRFYVA
jgi:hypothetical protein